MNSTSDMQVTCFGSHQINLPESFGLRKPGSSVTFYYGHGVDFKTIEFQVVGEKVTDEEYLGALVSRAEQIESKINEKVNLPMLIAQEDLGDNVFLLRYFENRLSDNYHIHEVHRLIDGVHVFFQADSFEGKMDPVETHLKQLARGIVLVSDDSDASGFCLGPVVVDSQSDYQLATIHYRDESVGHRDIAVEIEVNTLPQRKGESRLISRMNGNILALGRKPQVIREGKTELAGMAAEQWLGRAIEDKRVAHLFVIDSYPEKPTSVTPRLQIALRTGGVPRSPIANGLRPYIESATHVGEQPDPVTSSLSDEETTALWEVITNSVRAR